MQCNSFKKFKTEIFINLQCQLNNLLNVKTSQKLLKKTNAGNSCSMRYKNVSKTMCDVSNIYTEIGKYITGQKVGSS